MIDRRAWLLRLASIGTLDSVNAQPRVKARRIGVLYFGGEESRLSARHEALVRGLRELGHIDGENLVLELRFADSNAERLDQQVAELLRMDVALIVATSTLTGQAAQRQTRVVPIVVAATADPVGDGFAQSLARPGLNITGMSTSAADSVVEHLGMFALMRPRPARVAVLANPLTRAHGLTVPSSLLARADEVIE
jgi:putative tryptophan/tyrosine transport system substrate-binding protein